MGLSPQMRSARVYRRRALFVLFALAAIWPSRVLGQTTYITTAAGTGTGGFSGDNGPPTQAALFAPATVVTDASGNVFIADQANHRIRKILPGGTIITLAGTGVAGFAGDAGAATSAQLNCPGAVAVDSTGNLYIADTNNFRIRKIDTTGTIRTITGNGVLGFSGNNGPAIDAQISSVSGLTVDAAGNLFLVDRNNNRIRKIGADGIISTVAGNGNFGFAGDGGNAVNAQLSLFALVVEGCEQGPGLAVDAAGNLYIADSGAFRVRRVDTEGKIRTFAGTGEAGSTGDGSPALAARLDMPMGLSLDSAGNLYIALPTGGRVRRVNTEGFIHTVAGTGVLGFSGDGGLASSAQLNYPYSVAAEGVGAVLIADKLNHRVRRVLPTPSFTAQPTSLTFTASAGGGNPPSQTLSIRNNNPGAATWNTLFTSPGGLQWTVITPASGLTPSEATVGINTTGLAPGIYNGNIVLRSPLDSSVQNTVPVRLTISPAASIALTANALTFTATQGGSNPANQTINLTNSSGGPMSFTATATSTPGGWLTVSPTSSTAPATLTVSVNTTALTPGAYTGRVEVAATGATNSPQSITVVLNVNAAGIATIALNPSSLQFYTPVGANPASLMVQVDNSGTGTLGFTATATAQTGGNWLSVSPLTATAPATLTVSVNSATLTAGAYAGSITITGLAASNANNSPQTVPVTLAVGAPLIGQNGVVNGASFSTEATLSGRAIASLFGQGLSSTTQAAATLPLPTTLAGTQVLVNETAMPLFFISTGQINFQMPSNLSGATAQVVVVANGVRGPAATVRLVPELPGIFTASPSTQAAALNQDFTVNSASNPAAVGSILQLFATGMGATNPPLANGQVGATTPPLNETVQRPTVLIGGAAAEVIFSGAAPGFVGLDQVNVRIPLGTAAGNAVPVQIQVSGRSSNVVTVAVRQ